MSGAPPAIQIDRLQKNYHGLRPLRLQGLVVESGERVALAGLDVPSAEVLVNLIAGATLPDEGDVRTFDVSTASIESSGDWFQTLDRFGVVTHRAALLEGMSTAQNVALPMTIQLDPVPEPHATQARALVDEVGLPAGTLHEPVGAQPPAARARVHLARALALDPQLLLLEHPTVGLDSGDVIALARDVASIADARGMAVLSLTNDLDFARIASHRIVRLRPATGALEPVASSRRSRWIPAFLRRR